MIARRVPATEGTANSNRHMGCQHPTPTLDLEKADEGHVVEQHVAESQASKVQERAVAHDHAPQQRTHVQVRGLFTALGCCPVKQQHAVPQLHRTGRPGRVGEFVDGAWRQRHDPHGVVAHGCHKLLHARRLLGKSRRPWGVYLRGLEAQDGRRTACLCARRRGASTLVTRSSTR